MDTPKISVIIPVFNAASCLEECVASLLAQTEKRFELILVDDGSTDGSGQLCDRLSGLDERVRTLHKENGGAASARNMGLDNAKGDFIAFSDADDTVMPDFLEKLYNAATENGADIAMCDYIKHTKTSSFIYSSPIRGGVYGKDDIKKELYPCLVMFDDLEFPPTISNWVCLFRRSLIESIGLRYPAVRLCEDSYFGSVALYNAKGYVYLKGEALYDYRYTEGSLSHGVNPKRWESFILLNEMYEDYFKDKEEVFARQVKYNMIYFAMNHLGYIRSSNESFGKKVKQAKGIMGDERVKRAFKGTKLPAVSSKLKLSLRLVKYKQSFLYMLLLGRK